MDLLELWWVVEVLKGGAVAALGAVASSGFQWVSALFLSQEMPGHFSQPSFICIHVLHVSPPPLPCPVQFFGLWTVNKYLT